MHAFSRSLVLGLLLSATIAPASVAQSSELRVLTFNVLVDIEDGTDKATPWAERRALCVDVIRKADPDLMGLEENSPNQLLFFKEKFPQYDTFGEVPLSEADIAAISRNLPVFESLGFKSYTDVILFYKRDLFEKLDGGHWWLSPTGEKVSVGHGNAFPRVAVWAKLKHKPTGRQIIAVVTHFDNSLPAQTLMAAQSHERLAPLYEQGLPMLFLGDFNTDQKRGDYAKLTSDGWKDSYRASQKASPDGRDDNVPTTSRSRIDHIFYRGESLTPKTWERLDSPKPEIELSDHHPVLAIFDWTQ